MPPVVKQALMWVVGILLIVWVASSVRDLHTGSVEDVEYSQFRRLVSSGQMESAEITRNGKLRGKLKSGTHVESWLPPVEDNSFLPLLEANGVAYTGEAPPNPLWENLIVILLPAILVFGIFYFMMYRQAMGTGRTALSFGKSRAKVFMEKNLKVTFKDVAGCEESKTELKEIIEFLKDPKRYSKLGGKIPKGVLLVGPPGTGKTLLARAVAGEAGVPFFSISGSDFVEMFVGVGASRVRDLFEQGKKSAPCIIFIDEIDAVGRQRGAGMGGGHDEREQTLNALLVEMDGFETNEGVIIIAATNRPDVLDSALLRAGRFDRRIVVGLPDIKGRLGILKVHTRKVPLAAGVELERIAKGTPGFTGAELANLANEAALLAARLNKEKVSVLEFDEAKDKVMMGPERKSMVMSEKDKIVTAYHEAGHAVAAYLIPGTNPLHKVTIIPRGMAMGMTQQLPEEDKYTYPKSYWLGEICVSLGGRLAEEMIFKDVSTGASNDLERATNIARKMVCEWGMSDAVGPLSFGRRGEHVFLGRDLAMHSEFSEDTAKKIDAEIKRIVTECNERTRKLIEENRDTLERLSKALLHLEVLDADQLKAVMSGQVLVHEEADTSSDGGFRVGSETEGPVLKITIRGDGETAINGEGKLKADFSSAIHKAVRGIQEHILGSPGEYAITISMATDDETSRLVDHLVRQYGFRKESLQGAPASNERNISVKIEPNQPPVQEPSDAPEEQKS